MGSRHGRYEDERGYTEVRSRDRDAERDRAFDRIFQDDRRPEHGALVVRQREEGISERRRARSPSTGPIPVRYGSVSSLPPRAEYETDRTVIVDRERDSRYREPSRDRITTRIYDRERERERPRSPTPSPERERERDRIRIVERSRVLTPSPSPSPSPPPRPVIQEPVIERDVITHFTNVDHGTVYVRPPPPVRERERERERDRETEIDVYTSRHRTEVDVRDASRPRSRSRSRVGPARHSERDVLVRTDRDRDRLVEVDVDVRNGHAHGRRARSAAPPMLRTARYDDEARYIEARIDDRGEHGEAWHGATRDWTIVDVPPGTERVRMDGAGGAVADVTWERYSGVRRTRFMPERDDRDDEPRRRSQGYLPARDRDRDRGSRDHVNVQIHDQHRSRDRVGVDVDVDVDVDVGQYPVQVPAADMWTEITKDLVSREAIDQLGYAYTDAPHVYYILQYLYQDEVQELVNLSAAIRYERRRRQSKHRHPQRRDEVEVDVDVHRRRRSYSQSQHRPRRDEERVYEREVYVDRLHPVYRR